MNVQSLDSICYTCNKTNTCKLRERDPDKIVVDCSKYEMTDLHKELLKYFAELKGENHGR